MVEPTDLIVANLMATPTAPTDLDVTNKEGQLQSRLSMSVQAWKSQEESMRNLTATFEQNRNKHSDQQTTEQAERSTVYQSTLHSIENATCCMDGRGNLEDGISIHGQRSQGPRTMLIILT